MYRKLSYLMLVFIMFSLFTGLTVYISNPVNVVDNLGYLSESEIQHLQARIDEIKESYVLMLLFLLLIIPMAKVHGLCDDYYNDRLW